MSENGFFKNRGVDVKVCSLTKSYETSAEQVRALKGVDWQIGTGRRSGADGTIGLWQDDVTQYPRRRRSSPAAARFMSASKKLMSLSERDLEKYRLAQSRICLSIF